MHSFLSQAQTFRNHSHPFRAECSWADNMQRWWCAICMNVHRWDKRKWTFSIWNIEDAHAQCANKQWAHFTSIHFVRSLLLIVNVKSINQKNSLSNYLAMTPKKRSTRNHSNKIEICVNFEYVEYDWMLSLKQHSNLERKKEFNS